MYGTQAVNNAISADNAFENDVKMYGTQASYEGLIIKAEFENDVKMYGTQAYLSSTQVWLCLRMM